MERRGNRVGMHFAVDWEALRAALVCRGEEWTYYLDPRTGDIRRSRFAGFREEGDELSGDEVSADLEDGYLAPIEPLPYLEEYRWMVEACASLPVASRERLAAALRRPRPLRTFQESLVGSPFALRTWRAVRRRSLGLVAAEWVARQVRRP